MTGQQIIDRALRLSNTNEVDFIFTNESLNLTYQNLCDRIVNEVWEGYFWDIGKTNLVASQNEYVIEKLGIDPNSLDIKKINKVFLKYGNEYVRAYAQSPSLLDQHPDYYNANTSESHPFFYVKDVSIFIFPAPKHNIVNWIELHVAHSPADITSATLEDGIEIPRQYHNVIAQGIVVDIYQEQGKINEKNDAFNQFEMMARNMINDLKERINLPWIVQIPNLSIYE